MFGLRQRRIRLLKLNKFLKLMRTDRFSDIKSAFENKEYEKIKCFSNRLADKNRKGEYILDFK
jgi:Txe/YoeB family toxin of Txe-Axe toxin-antitoxin module